MRVTPRLRVIVMTTVPQTLAAFFPRQLQSLAEAGFDVHAVSSPGADLDLFDRIPGVIAHAVPMERQPHPLRDSLALIKLHSLVRRLQPHIVHAHTPKAGLLGMAAAKAAGVPIRLYTIHGLPLETRTGRWRRILEAAERASISLSTQAYTISPSLEKVVVDLQLCSPSKVTTLGDGSCAGIDVEHFDGDADRSAQRTQLRASLGVPQEALLISFVGRLARDKGVGILADAWLEIARVLPNAHLLLAGELDGTDPVSEVAMQALRAHPRVHLPGAIAKADVGTVYAATDIFALPSFREGLSQVALEAGAMGVPIVSTRVTGLVDAVVDGVTGLLVPAGEAGPLAAAIINLATHSDLRDGLARAAKAHVRTKFAATRVNRLWMGEYRRLVRESLPSSASASFQIEDRI